MSTKVQKWGNSLALRLPKEIAADLNIKEGSEIMIESKAKKIIIKPLRKIKRKANTPTLEELVGKITNNNRHPLEDWGSPVGKEVW